MVTEDRAIPLLMDDSGYQARQADLDLVGISNEQLRAMLDQDIPLGMSQETYEEFTRSLLFALKKDRIDTADIRIQGSTVKFFSGTHKYMPYTLEEVHSLYVESRTQKQLDEEGGVSKLKLTRIWTAIQSEWPEGGGRPKRRIFDSLYTLGIRLDKSDCDVQICSDQLYELLDEYFEHLGLSPDNILVDDPDYACVDSKYLYSAFRYLAAWETHAYDILGRPVELAVFRSAGPPPTFGNVGMSSHPRDDDWILHSQRNIGQ